MFRRHARINSQSIEEGTSSLSAILRAPARWIRSVLTAILLLYSFFSTGCNTLSLPAIDPTGNRIFSHQWTRIISPHDPNNGYPSQQPAFQTPPEPPPCLQGASSGGKKTLCKGCLAGKGCLHRKKEAEEMRGRCGQLLLTPTRIVAPVGGEVILLAGVCGKDEYLVTNEPIEWMLAPDSVGEIVAVGDDAKGEARSLWKKEINPKVEKLDVDFARGRTSRESGVITRGTSDPSDDLPIRKGQTWISLTSPSEGVTKVTALAPDSDVWDKRRQTATIYWVDASWQFPTPQTAISGEPVRLVTRVLRSEGYIPAEGWKVRYRVQNPEFARFLPTQAESAIVDVNADGVASVDIVNGRSANSANVSPNGTAIVDIEIIRPVQSTDKMPQLELGRSSTTVTWTSPDLLLNVVGPEIAVPGQALTYMATLANTGDMLSENTVLSVTIPNGMTVQSTNHAATKSVNGAFAWEIGPLQPRHTFDLAITLIPTSEMDARIQFDAVGSPNLAQRKVVATLVQRPAVTLQMVPRQNITQIEVGNQVAFDITVTNAGNQTINDVSVALQSDPGLQHIRDGGNESISMLGFLNPGQSRQLEAIFTVQREGDMCVRGTVQALGQTLGTQQACIRGIAAAPKRPSIQLQIDRVSPEGPIPIGGEFQVDWSITNTGPVPVRNPLVSMQHDQAVQAISISQSGNYRVEQQLAQWNIADMPPNTRLTFTARFRASQAVPQSRVIVDVKTTDGLADQKGLSIEIRNTAPSNASFGTGGSNVGLGRPNLDNLDLSASRLAVSIQPVSNSIHQGDVATYEIRIENMQSKPDQRVALSLQLPKGATLSSIRSADLQYKLSNQNRQIDLEPIQFFRANDVYSCVVQLRHNDVTESELVASVVSMGQPSASVAKHTVRVLPR